MSVDVLPDLAQHQEKAQRHVNYWNDNILSNMIATNGHIIGYATQFKEFHSTLIQFTEQKKYKELADGLKILQDTITTQKKAAKNLVDQLNTFQVDLNDDDKNFTKDYNTAKQKLGGDHGQIVALENELDSIHSAMRRDIAMMAGGGAGILAGGIMIEVGAVCEFETGGLSTGLVGAGIAVAAGGAGTAIAGSADYNKQIGNLNKVTAEITYDEQQLTELTTVHHQLGGFVSSNQLAVTGTQALVSAWDGLKSDLQNVIDALEELDSGSIPWPSSLIVDQLNTAYSDWDDALTLAKKMQPNGQVSSKYYKKLHLHNQEQKKD